MDEIGAILAIADKITTVGLLAIFAIAIFKKWIVIGWTYKACEDEVEYWRDIALTAIPALKEVVTKK